MSLPSFSTTKRRISIPMSLASDHRSHHHHYDTTASVRSLSPNISRKRQKMKRVIEYDLDGSLSDDDEENKSMNGDAAGTTANVNNDDSNQHQEQLQRQQSFFDENINNSDDGDGNTDGAMGRSEDIQDDAATPLVQQEDIQEGMGKEEEVLVNDDDHDDDQNNDYLLTVTPTTEQLSSLCWNCHVTLRLSADNFCFYAMHVHPLLQVPICSVCNETVLQSYYNTTSSTATTTTAATGGGGGGSNSSVASEADVCCGCASEEEDATLLLCDACPKAFCELCVAQAYGGGRSGALAVRQLMIPNDDPWKCPVCSPTAELQKLQQELRTRPPPPQVARDIHLSQDSTDPNHDSTTVAQPTRSVETILKELAMVEAEQEDFQRQWDDPRAVEAQRQQIEQEIRQGKPNIKGNKLKALVDDELETARSLAVAHDFRLGDMASSLQEELELVHNVDLAVMYKKCFSDTTTTKKDSTENDDDEEEDEPDWKISADKEIARRRALETTTTIQPIHAPNVYLKEAFVDVEDLMTRPEDERDCNGVGFRSTMDRPSQQQMQDALEFENAILAEKNVRIRTSVDNDADVEEVRAEEWETSQLGAAGVSRIRRDAFVEEMRVQSKKKKAIPARVPPPPISPPAALASQVQSKPPRAAVSELRDLLTQAAQATEEQQNSSEAKALPVKGDVVDLTADNSPLVPKKKRLFLAGRDALMREPPKREEHESIPVNPFNWRYNKHLEEKKEIFDEEYYCSTDPQFTNSDLVLASPDFTKSLTEGKAVKTIAVSTHISKHLKPHQKEGVKFLWNNACSDLAVRTDPTEKLDEERDVGGCILAHSMGLGKSLTAISLLCTLFNHPSLVDGYGIALVKTALLVVPVNTIASWQNEFSKWTTSLRPIMIYALHSTPANHRESAVSQWCQRGGVMLLSKDSFPRYSKAHPSLQIPGPDILVLDEAHLMLANRNNVIYKALSNIQTKRRLLLTGSPFQNNALEYYRMIHYMRPGVLDTSETLFEREFARPINSGMPSDATPAEKLECNLKSKQLKNILAPYVHRKDSTVLQETLPPMQQVILHVRQTKLQSNLYKALKRFEERKGITSYLTRYQLAKPIHNHPACLLMKASQAAEEDSDDSDTKEKRMWFDKKVQKIGEDKMKAVEKGNKVVMLLHILTHSDLIGDKVVVFANCIKTLDFLEEALQLCSWTDHASTLAAAFPGTQIGGWKKGREYLRIDGSDTSDQRGSLIKKFNQNEGRLSERAKCFLISAKAGGIGITLTAANRVVCFDTHFNPTIMNQAVCRVYRYGQEKSVFVYRFLTEGTGEEKIYQRSVNKTGLSLRVLDGKNFEGQFTSSELANLVLNDTWVQCERCEKWRMLLGSREEEDLPDKWYCEMNTLDEKNNNCDASEKSNRWYHSVYHLKQINLEDSAGAGDQNEETGPANRSESWDAEESEDDPKKIAAAAKKEAQTKTDPVLTKLLGDDFTEKLVSKYYFHDTLLEAADEEAENDKVEALEKASEDDSAGTDNDDMKPAAMDNGSVHDNNNKRKLNSSFYTNSDIEEFGEGDDSTTPNRTNDMAAKVKMEKAADGCPPLSKPEESVRNLFSQKSSQSMNVKQKFASPPADIEIIELSSSEED